MLDILVGSILNQLGADLFSSYTLSDLCALVDPFLQCPKRFSGDTNHFIDVFKVEQRVHFLRRFKVNEHWYSF